MKKSVNRNVHLKQHSQKSPYTYTTCEKMFYSKCGFETIHVDTLKLYNLCKRFSQNGSFNRHMEIHSNQRPFNIVLQFACDKESIISGFPFMEWYFPSTLLLQFLYGFLSCKRLMFLLITFEQNELESCATSQIIGN